MLAGYQKWGDLKDSIDVWKNEYVLIESQWQTYKENMDESTVVMFFLCFYFILDTTKIKNKK